MFQFYFFKYMHFNKLAPLDLHVGQPRIIGDYSQSEKENTLRSSTPFSENNLHNYLGKYIKLLLPNLLVEPFKLGSQITGSCGHSSSQANQNPAQVVSGSRLQGDEDDELGPRDLPAVFCYSAQGLWRRTMSKFMSQHYIYPSIVRNTASTCVKHNHLLA